MVPNKLPIFHVNNVCKSKDYEENGKRTTVGWLKYLFLWREDEEGFSLSSKEDYKDYNKALNLFKKISHVTIDIHEWEDKVSIAKQIRCLNKFREKFLETKGEIDE